MQTYSKTYSCTLLLFLISIFFSCQKDIPEDLSKLEQAERLYKTAPEKAYALLDSLASSGTLSAGSSARRCMRMGLLADSIQTDLPYSFQLERAARYYHRHGSDSDEARILLYLGRAYMEDKNPEKALSTYLQAQELALKDCNWGLLGYISGYIADTYHYQGTQSLAIEKYRIAANYFHRAKNFRSEGISFLELSRSYAFADSLDLALYYVQKADSLIVLYGKVKENQSVLNAYVNIYTKKNDYKLAESYLKKSKDFLSLKDASSYLALSNLYLLQGKLDLAKMYLTESIEIPSLNKEVPIAQLYLLFNLEKQLGNTEAALSALERFVDVFTSSRDIKNKTEVLSLEKKYNYINIEKEHFRLKLKYRRSFTLVIILFSGLIIVVVLYRLRLKSRQLQLKERENELYQLRSLLYNREKELSDLVARQEAQQNLLNRKVQELYNQKIKEVDQIRSQIQQKNREMMQNAAITKRLQKLAAKIIPNSTKSPLSAKDWEVAVELVNWVYPIVPSLVESCKLSEKETTVCYLSMFELSANEEAILMNQPIGSINKYRQTLRKKLQINDRNTEIYEFIASLC